MKIGRRQFAGATMLSAVGLTGSVSGQDKGPGAEPETTTIRGRVVCVTEEYERLFKVVADCGHRGHAYALKTADGKLHPFLPTDSAAAIFLDQRYRERELQVTARRFPETGFIEVIRLQSWREGRVYNLGYYCEVCNIWTHKPGPCECCQEPVEFRETLPGESDQ